MSFFRSIKGTLNNVQKDLTNSFKSLTTSNERKSKKKASSSALNFDNDVNPDAGADLLHKNEENWAAIHNSIEESAAVAQKVDLAVSDIFVFYERQNEALSDFISELSILPQLTTDINGVVKQLGELEENFSTIENMLLSLEDVCEQQEFVQSKKKHHNELEVYRQLKNMELEIVKVDLAKEHAKKVQIHESKLQENIREKQKAIEEAYHYEEEIQKYKVSGATKLKPQSSTTSSDADLAEICVEEDNSALEDFLNQEDDSKDVTDKPEDKEFQELETQDTVDDKPASGSDEEFKDTEEFIQVKADEDIKDEDLKTASNSQQTEQMYSESG